MGDILVQTDETFIVYTLVNRRSARGGTVTRFRDAYNREAAL